MESTASFIITSTIILGIILVILIFLLILMEHKPAKKSVIQEVDNGPSRPNPPYIINLKSTESHAYGAICISDRDVTFSYDRSDLRDIQHELATLKSSLDLLSETPYEDIRQSRYLAMLHTLERLKNMTSITDPELTIIKDELKRYKISLGRLKNN